MVSNRPGSSTGRLYFDQHVLTGHGKKGGGVTYPLYTCTKVQVWLIGKQ